MKKLDKVDKKIIQILQKNARTPLKEIVNRNWLLHGKSCRVIERYECIQLFNALSVIEFVFSISNRLR